MARIAIGLYSYSKQDLRILPETMDSFIRVLVRDKDLDHVFDVAYIPHQYITDIQPTRMDIGYIGSEGQRVKPGSKIGLMILGGVKEIHVIEHINVIMKRIKRAKEHNK